MIRFEKALRSRSMLIGVTIVVATLAGLRAAHPWRSGQFELGEAFDEESANEASARLAYEWKRLHDPATGKIPERIRERELSFARTLPRVPEKRPSLMKRTAGTWTSRGPVNQGGRTRALAYDISNTSVLLAGGISGGMWRTDNGGSSWTRTTSLSDTTQSVTCIAQDPRTGHQNVWYYGTGEQLGNSAGGGGGATYLGNGIFRSTDGGVTWSRLPATSTNSPQNPDVQDYCWTIAVSPVDGSVYAAFYGTLMKSTDQGDTWSVLKGGSSPFSPYVDVQVTSTGVVYAAFSSESSEKGIFRSTDGGGTWTNITAATWPSTYTRTLLAVAPSNESVVYALAETPGSGFKNTDNNEDYWTSFFKYTYLSGDGSGANGTWVDRSANLPAYGGNVGNFTHQHSYDLLVKVLPSDENTVFIGGTNLYRSTDGFASTGNTTWIGGYSTANDISQYPEHHPDQHSLAFNPGLPNSAISGHDGGVSRTANLLDATVSWTLINTGYTTSQFYSVAIDPVTAGDPVIIGGLQDNGHLFTNSTDPNTPWKALPFGGDGTITAIANGRSSYYICTQNGSVSRLLLDANGTMTDYATVQPVATGFDFVTPYILDPANTDRMYMAVGDRVWRNSDLTGITLATVDQNSANNPTSTNWTELTNSAVASDQVTALAASTDPVGQLYYGTANGVVLKIGDATTGDPAPTTITGAGFPSGAYVSSIAVNPRNSDTALVVFSNYGVKSLFLTTDGGSTWSDVSGNLEENPDGSGRGPSCRWASILPMPGGMIVYVGTSTGLYSCSSVNGTSTVWAQEGAETIGNVVVDMVVTRAADDLVVAGTHANGVFSSTAMVTGVHESQPAGTPLAFGLSQNYPNPFNPSTSVRFTLRQAGTVQLVVTDLSGRRIATLVDSYQSAGEHTATWDGTSENGSTVSSGMYLCELRAPGVHDVRKMTLLK